MHGDDDVAFFSSLCRRLARVQKGKLDVIIITSYIFFSFEKQHTSSSFFSSSYCWSNKNKYGD